MKNIFFYSLATLITSTLVHAKDFSEQQKDSAYENIIESSNDHTLIRHILNEILSNPSQWRSNKIRKKEDEFISILRKDPRYGNEEYLEKLSKIIFYRLNQEVSRRKPNTLVIRSLLKYVDAFSNNEWSRDLNQLKDLFLDNTKIYLSDRAYSKKRKATEAAFIDILRSWQSNMDQEVQSSDENTVPLFADLVKQAEKEGQNPQLKTLVKKFLAQIEDNFYDREANRINQGIEYKEFLFRDKEARKLAEALYRLEKGHAFLTGKAGVGKTSLAKLVMRHYFDGKALFPGDKIPLMFEVPVSLLIGNKTEFKDFVKTTQKIAQALGRHIILFSDESHVASKMTQNSIKNILTQDLNLDNNPVHLIWASTSTESKTFLQDSALMRRWVFNNIDEFNAEQTAASVNQSYIVKWREHYSVNKIKFNNIEPEAISYAFRYSALEQPHAGNPGATKELLEGSIGHKLAQLVRENPVSKKIRYNLKVEDIQNYLRFHKDKRLVPGDPDFEEIFQFMWKGLEARAGGNEGFMHQLKKNLMGHFASTYRNMMSAFVFHGPPGGGKTHVAEAIATEFFDGAILRINAGEFKDSASKSKVEGAAPGLVGYTDDVSKFSRFFAENPNGGVIKIEEADYLNEYFIQMLTNMISDKEWTDAKNNTFSTENYILILNTNFGQEFLVPPRSQHKLDWNAYNARRKSITDIAVVDDREIEVIKPSKLNAAFEGFIEKIVTTSNPSEDTSIVSQEMIKQKRRYKAFYLLSPDKEELIEAAKRVVNEYLNRIKEDFNVTLKISEKTILDILDIDYYEFEKGYTYVISQFENKLFTFLNSYLSHSGETISVSTENIQRTFNNQIYNGQDLIIKTKTATTRYVLDRALENDENPWSNDEAFRERIDNLEERMSEHLIGHTESVRELKKKAQLKLIDWNTRMVFTEIGTSGNGKTEKPKSIAKALYDDESAYFILEGITTVSQLNNYFRPPQGYVGAKEETRFQEWVKARIHSGGGVIVLDEVLSFFGLTRVDLAEKVAILNRIYSLLDEGFLTIGSKQYDLRAFTIVLTGNAMQELFDVVEDLPGSDEKVRKIIEKVSEQDIIDYFRQHGFDAAKLARLGYISLNGPLDEESTRLVGQKMMRESIYDNIQSNLSRQRRGAPVPDIKIPNEILEEITKKVKTVRLGMRKVNTAIQTILSKPIAGILNDFPQATNIQAKMTGDKESKNIQWYVKEKGERNKKAVYLHSILNERGKSKLTWTKVQNKDSKNLTPQIQDLEEPERVILSEQALNKTATHEVYGHWMTDVLLFGRNDFELITTIPKNSYLGAVLRMQKDVIELTGITYLLKTIVTQEAGHRAVFLRGIFNTGGGTSATDKELSKRTDDMALVEKNLNKMLSNHLLLGYNDFDSENRKAWVKRLIREVLKEVTDRVIKYGIKSNNFDSMFKLVKKDRVVDQKTLDNYVEDLKKKNLLQDHDFVFLFFLEQVIAEYLKENNNRNTQLLLTLLKSSLLEIKTIRTSINKQFQDWLTKTLKKYEVKEPSMDVDCETLYLK